MGQRIMQFSPRNHDMPLRSACGAWLSAERAVSAAAIYKHYPIEERIS